MASRRDVRSYLTLPVSFRMLSRAKAAFEELEDYPSGR